MKNTRLGLRATIALAALASAAGFSTANQTERRQRKPVPMMIAPPAGEVDAWNRAVDQRKAAHPKRPRRVYATGQYPKLAEARIRKQHKHPARDQHGAYTLVGRDAMPNGQTDGRRMWLGGISAQRGF